MNTLIKFLIFIAILIVMLNGNTFDEEEDSKNIVDELYKPNASVLPSNVKEDKAESFDANYILHTF
uniref:Uncharacterized protein n=1 Tax=Strongyloides venezuelensis TaxID=75913 RepID=A0A0K0ETY8_STRVS